MQTLRPDPSNPRQIATDEISLNPNREEQQVQKKHNNKQIL